MFFLTNRAKEGLLTWVNRLESAQKLNTSRLKVNTIHSFRPTIYHQLTTNPKYWTYEISAPLTRGPCTRAPMAPVCFFSLIGRDLKKVGVLGLKK